MIRFTIPGEPHAQARARAVAFAGRARMYDPKNNREWKGRASYIMRQAMDGRDPLDGPVALTVEAWFTMPKSRWLKRAPRDSERHTKRPDLDNIVKAVKDAAKGVLWVDDSQVCAMTAHKWTAAQGHAPRVEVTVAEVNDAEA